MGTASVQDAGREVEQAGSRVAAHPGMQAVARLGIFSKSVVYAVLAALALMAAMGTGGETTDTRGAIAAIAHRPYGRALVALLSLGFYALAAWFIVEPIANREGRSRGWTGVVSRVGKAIGGLTYVGLATWAATVALGHAAGPPSNALVRSYTGHVLSWPAGRALVAIGGVVALVIGVHQLQNGWKTFTQPWPKLALGRMTDALRPWAPRLSLAGYATQGSIMGIIGAFLLVAAWHGNPRKAVGFDGALARLAQEPYGLPLLAIAALGLLAYAATAAIEARCQRL